MPVKVLRRNGIFRVVEANTGRIAKNAGGTAVDGGGHSSRRMATGQVRAINASTSGTGRVRKRRKV
jgi:hypothetical protein